MGSYGLPALHVNPPGDPTEGIKNALALKGMLQNQAAQQQEQQLRALEIQKAQQQQKDQQTAMQTIAQAGGDMSKALPALQGKVSPGYYQTLVKSDLDTRKELSDYDAKKFELTQKKHGALADLYQQAQNLPDDQYAQAWPQIASQANEIEPKLKLDPSQPIPKQSLQQLGLGLSVTENYLKTEQERRAQQKAPLEMQKLQAEAAKAQAEADQIKQFGGTGVEAREMSDWLAKNLGKGPSDFMAFKAKLVPQFNFNLQNTGTTGNVADVAKRFGMTPAAFDQAAEKYIQTGQLPPSGRGGPSLALNKAIMNRGAELHPGESLAENSATFKANQESLKKLQAQTDAVEAFENTAGKNIDRLLQTAQSIPDIGSRFGNIPVRMISDKLIGSENMARFKADLMTAQNEAAKVLNSANLSGVLSDSARKELQELADGNLPYKSLKGAFEEIKFDMNNRKNSYQEQIKDIKGRMSTKPSGGGKTLSISQIQQAAKDHGVSVDEAKRQAIAAGYQVQ